MEYFKVLYDFENSDDAIYLRIDESEIDFDRYRVNSGEKMNVEYIPCTVEQEDTNTFDYLANDLVWLVVNEKVKNIIENYNNGDVEFIPMINKENQQRVGYLVNCLNVIEALDEEHSLLSKTPYIKDGQKKMFLSVIKYSLKKEKIHELDLFRLKEDDIPIFMSQKLLKQFNSHGIKGFDFTKVKVY